jgi:hypothetical protein
VHLSQSIAKQLLDADVELDFDQILAKRPRSRDSGMPWHQDAVRAALLRPVCLLSFWFMVSNGLTG